MQRAGRFQVPALEAAAAAAETTAAAVAIYAQSAWIFIDSTATKATTSWSYSNAFILHYV